VQCSRVHRAWCKQYAPCRLPCQWHTLLLHKRAGDTLTPFCTQGMLVLWPRQLHHCQTLILGRHGAFCTMHANNECTATVQWHGATVNMHQVPFRTSPQVMHHMPD
jgi:hypothetical protein